MQEREENHQKKIKGGKGKKTKRESKKKKRDNKKPSLKAMKNKQKRSHHWKARAALFTPLQGSLDP